MFKGKTIWAIIQIGGFTMYILVLCSIVSIAVLIERILYYHRKSSVKRTKFMDKISDELENGNTRKAIEICKGTNTPFSKVVYAGLNLYGHNERILSQAMEREITVETIKLERFTSIVGTIGSTAVYIGLLGTVLGIIRAFNDISLSGSTGVNAVIGGIPEALVCTAGGLLVAIPAVMSYNFFIRKIDNFVAEMELCASELLDLLYVEENETKTKKPKASF